MIPVLYSTDNPNFDSNGLGKMVDTIVCQVTEIRNGAFDLYLEYPVSGRLYPYIEQQMYIKAKPNTIDEPHIFRIYDHQLDTISQKVTINATTITNDLGYNMVTDVTITNATPQEAMDQMKSRLMEPTTFGFYSNIATRSSTRWTRRNPLNCIAGEEGSLLQYWGGEIKRTNDGISLLARRGRDNVTVIRHGTSISGVEITYSTKGLVTVVVPIYTYSPDGQDNEVTLVGTTVKSQHINKYPNWYIVEVDYSGDEEVKDLASLNRKAGRYFSDNAGVDVPTINATVTIDDISDSKEYEQFKNLENIELTDTVTVYAKQYGVNINAKVNSIVFDVLSEKNVELELGSLRSTIFDTTNREVKNLVRNVETSVSNQINANGKNKVFTGTSRPSTGMSKNDIWIEYLGTGGMMINTFNGTEWRPERMNGSALYGNVDFGTIGARNLNLSQTTTQTIKGDGYTNTLLTGESLWSNSVTGEKISITKGRLMYTDGVSPFIDILKDYVDLKNKLIDEGVITIENN